jgi:hypothetical protein
MADWKNYLTPAPPVGNMNVLSAYYRPPSLQDVVAVAAYGDARQNARIRKKLQEIRLRDELARRRPSWAHGKLLLSSSPGSAGPQPAHIRPPRLTAPLPGGASASDKIERSAGRKRTRKSDE